MYTMLWGRLLRPELLGFLSTNSTEFRNFTGTERRFEKKGVMHGVTIIDDYAHHPQEIAATLAAAAGIPIRSCKRIPAPYHSPGQRPFWMSLPRALSADEVVLADILQPMRQILWASAPEILPQESRLQAETSIISLLLMK